MLRLQVNFKSGLPVYLQLVDQGKAAAASGAWEHGEPLPSIRPLAEELRVNRNTIGKAYAELERRGVIETRPGKGCFLKQNNSPYRAKVREEMLTEQIDAMIVQAHHLQIDEENLQRLLQERLKHFEEQRQQAEESKKEKTT
jgi:GntR family transcriptional regulator